MTNSRGILEDGKKLAGKHPNAYKTANDVSMTRYMQFWEAIELEMAHIHETISGVKGRWSRLL